MSAMFLWTPRRRKRILQGSGALRASSHLSWTILDWRRYCTCVALPLPRRPGQDQIPEMLSWKMQIRRKYTEICVKTHKRKIYSTMDSTGICAVWAVRKARDEQRKRMQTATVGESGIVVDDRVGPDGRAILPLV